VLRQNQFNLQKIILQDPLSPLHPGSKWHPVPLLDPILSNHHLWPRVSKQFTSGFHWPLQPIPEDIHAQLVQEAITYGNHKSARAAKSELIPSLQLEASKGWQLPLPINLLTEILGLDIAALGYVHQFGLNTDTGKRTEKGCTNTLMGTLPNNALSPQSVWKTAPLC
jgi:hypothetical protein